MVWRMEKWCVSECVISDAFSICFQAVLDINAGTWGRILPAGDPGASGGRPTFPSPRAGAAAFSYTSALVGLSRNTSSDTIVCHYHHYNTSA